MNGHVLEPAERAEAHLPEQVEAHQGHYWCSGRERVEGRERSMRHVQPRHDEQRAEGHQHQHAARLVHPLPDAEAANRQQHQRAERNSAHHRDERAAGGQPVATRPDHVREVLRRLNPGFRRVEDREQPQVPCHEETSQLVESELRPLIQAALERHQTIEVDHDDSGGQIEERHRDDPEDDVRGAQLRGDAHPGQADDEEDLREGEIGETELAHERGAARFDRSFLAEEVRLQPDTIGVV